MDLYELNSYTPPIDKVKALREQAYLSIDQNMLFFMLGYVFLTGITGALYSMENGWIVGFVLGGFTFGMQLLFNRLPNRHIRRYLLGFSFAVFTILFIYFTQGAIYTQLTLVVSLILLSLYGNWRYLMPYVLIITIYYVMAFFQFKAGNNWSQYFIQNSFIEQSYQQTFLIITLVGTLIIMLMVFLCLHIDSLLYREARVTIFLEDQLNVDHNVTLVNQIANGQLDGKYESNENDQIGKALVHMRKELNTQAVSDQKKQWISDGVALMGDILLSSADVSEICHNILREIIRYVGLEHGGIFIVNNSDYDNPYLELRSFFAFDRPEFIDHKIQFGEGLVGEAADRKTSLLLREIPSSFESISSGLGSALPENIFIVPLMVKSDIMGVIELASLRKIEAHELEFVEKVAANIALSILSANAATQTTRLLTESQVYNEQMKAQEEEMRTSMEALRQTQDELSKQIDARATVQSELSARMHVVNKMAIVAEIDLIGNFIYINHQFSQITGYSDNDCLDKHFSILRHPDTAEELFDEIWLTINRKETFVGAFKSINQSGNPIWFEVAIAPVLDQEEQPVKFLCIGFDITQLKIKEDDIKSLLGQAKARNEMLNHKEETMQRNLEALEVAEEELSEQIQMSIRNQEFHDLVLTFVKGILYRSVLRKEWVLDFISTGVYELTGYDSTEFLGRKPRSFNSIIHPDDLVLIQESISNDLTIIEESSTSAVKGFQIRYRIIRADGEVRWVEERGKKFYDHYLKKDILTGFIYDITETLNEDA